MRTGRCRLLLLLLQQRRRAGVAVEVQQVERRLRGDARRQAGRRRRRADRRRLLRNRCLRRCPPLRSTINLVSFTMRASAAALKGSTGCAMLPGCAAPQRGCNILPLLFTVGMWLSTKALALQPTRS